MKPNSKIALLLLIMTLPILSTGQKLDHVQGDILVLLEKDESPTRLLNKYKRFQGKNTKIKIEQIIKDPLNIWQVTIDYKVINENKILTSIDGEPEVMASQKNFLLQYRKVPDDPFFNQQWQYINNGGNGSVNDVDTDIEIAWDITTGGLTAMGDTIVVCVIDDGTDKLHQDLIPNYWKNKNEIADNGIDDDLNGYVDDVYGWDAINEDGNVFREGSHGTSVSGIVGARGNNKIGVAGVNWNVKIMTIRGSSNSTNALRAYIYPYLQRRRYNESNGQEGAFVVSTNASWGFPYKKEIDSPIFCAFYDVLGSVGITNVTATTNENLDVEKDGDLPSHCSSPHLITVTNLTKMGLIAPNAGYGNISIDLAAPGNRLYTTGKPDRYREFEGTSGSSPLVAGAIGLLYSVPCTKLITLAKTNPEAASLFTRDIIIGTVDHNPNMAGRTFTEGNLNIGTAVTSVENMCNTCTYPMDVQSVTTSESISLIWENQNFASSASVRYREIGGEWKFQSNLQNSYTIQNLSGCTVYEVQFRSTCSGSGPYSHSYYFKTDNCCNPPENIFIENNNNSIVLNWEDISAADNYEVEFSPIGENNWQKVAVTEPSFILYGVTSCSTYKFRVNSKCGFRTTEFSNEQNNTINCSACQNAGYCEEVFMDNDYEWIQSIKIDSFQYESGKNSGGYGNYIGLPGIILKQGEEIKMEVVIAYNDISFIENTVAYFDWNQNGIFEPEERAFNPTSGSNMISAMVFVPTNALPGITRMRVILSYEDITSGCKDLTIESGEIEDYCVVVQSAAECTGVLTIDNFSTTSSSISLLWTEIQDAQSYQLDYKEEKDEEFTSLSTASTEILISNLNECSTYIVKVKSLCNSGSTEPSRETKIRTRCSTSVLDPEGILHSYTISPNPFSDQLNIVLDGNFDNYNTKILLFDIQGKELIGPNEFTINNSNIQINQLSNLRTGIYILRIQNGPLLITEKLVKI